MAAQAEVTEVSRAEMKDAGSGADAEGLPAAAETAGEHAVPDVRRDILDSGKIALRCPRRADAAGKGAEALRWTDAADKRAEALRQGDAAEKGTEVLRQEDAADKGASVPRMEDAPLLRADDEEALEAFPEILTEAAFGHG